MLREVVRRRFRNELIFRMFGLALLFVNQFAMADLEAQALASRVDAFIRAHQRDLRRDGISVSTIDATYSARARQEYREDYDLSDDTQLATWLAPELEQIYGSVGWLVRQLTVNEEVTNKGIRLITAKYETRSPGRCMDLYLSFEGSRMTLDAHSNTYACSSTSAHAANDVVLIANSRGCDAAAIVLADRRFESEKRSLEVSRELHVRDGTQFAGIATEMTQTQVAATCANAVARVYLAGSHPNAPHGLCFEAKLVRHGSGWLVDSYRGVWGLRIGCPAIRTQFNVHRSSISN